MKKPVVKNKLIEAFTNNPHVSTATVAKRLGCSPAYAYSVRSEMQPADYVREEKVESPGKNYCWLVGVVTFWIGLAAGLAL